jgi:UDP-glucose 4-epimerase
MTSVLVTGGNGFIGRYVTEELLWRGYDVAVLDTRYRDPAKHGIKVVLGDVRDPVAVTEAVAHADAVVHLAGVLGTQETIANPRPAAEVNILGGLNVFEAAAQYSTPMVNIAVGNAWSATNTYSITKSTMERFAEMFRDYRDTPITVVRALNAYGPRQVPVAPWGPSKVRKVMPSFILRALTGQPIEVYGDGGQVADMIYVTDVARILVDALEHTMKHGPITHVLEAGSGYPSTVLEIAETVAAAVAERTGAPPVPINHLPMRPGEPEGDVVLANPSTLDVIGVRKDELMTLSGGVKATVAYYSQTI